MNNSQLELYLLNINKSIELLKLVKSKNPNFQTILGNIDLKISTDYLVYYFQLSITQNQDVALKFLPDNLYDPFLIALAKNNLANCDSNSILFTNGDLGTFPLLYVQAKYGFRKDVYVLNMSMLNENYYIDALSKGTLNYKPLDFGFPFNIPENVVNYYYLINKSSICKTHLSIFIFLLQVPVLKIGSSVNDCLKKGNLKWKTDNDYLIFQDIAILSLIDKYFGVKPINFAITIPHNSYLGLYDFFSNSGIVYKLIDT